MSSGPSPTATESGQYRNFARQLEKKSGSDLNLLSNWVKWAIIALMSASVFYLKSSFVEKDNYARDRAADRKELDAIRQIDLDRFEQLERERSIRLDRLNSTLQDLALSIRTVQADKTPVYLTERIQVLERDLNEARKLLQELNASVSVLKQKENLR